MSRVKARFAAAALALTALLLPAHAGDGEYEADDAHEHGASFFGEVKDVRSFTPIESALIKLQVRGTMRFVLFQSDSAGQFRRSGLGTDVDPEKVDITCEKAGYRTIDVVRRRLSGAKDAPVEVECLLERGS